MATLRGNSVPTGSHSSLDRLRRVMADLISAEHSDVSQWQEFLDEAGGPELAEMGASLAQKSIDERAELIRQLAPFARNSDWNLRDSIARLFGAIGDRRAERYLRRLLDDQQEPLVRYSALKSLKKIGCSFSHREVDRLLRDPSPLVKEEYRRAIESSSKSTLAKDAADRKKHFQSGVKLFKDINNPTRLEIILILIDGERDVGEFVRNLGRSQSAISHHLASLRHGGLIACHRRGKRNHYYLTPAGRKLAPSINYLIAHVTGKVEYKAIH